MTTLEHDAAKALRDEGLSPRPQAAGDEGREPDVDAGHQQPLEVSFSLQERDLEERLAVDLEEIERGEDLPRDRVAHEGVAVRIELQLRLIAPVRNENAVDDRRRAPGLGRDRVIELARPLDLALVTDEMRTVVTDARDGACPHPVRLEDVVRQLRAFAGVAGSLRREIRAQDGLQLGRVSHPLDSQNRRSKIRTPVPNSL